MSAQSATVTAPTAPIARPSTPALLRLAMAALVVLAVLFFLAVRAGVKEHRTALTTVGKDSAPSILAAQQIRSNLADMHSNTANALLHAPGKGQKPLADYDKRRVAVTEGVLQAAGNITYDEAERAPLRRLLNELGKYEAAVAEALVLYNRKDRAGFLAAHREADRLMSKNILVAADDLDAVNRKEMDRAYAAARGGSLRATLLVVLAGAALLGVLAVVQVFLYRRMRRIVNPGLGAASLLALGFLVYVMGSFLGQRAALKTAKEDAFHSIHALWRARAEAYDANGDESRWLLDRPRADAYAQSFQAKVARLMTLPEGMTAQQLLASVRRGSVPAGFKGYLADELNNITFAGEREAAVACLEAWVRYVEIDGRIRALEGKDRHAEAVALCLGEEKGQSNWAFDQFDSALGKTIDINQKVFDDRVKQGLAELVAFDVTAPLIAVLVAALALAGLWPRLREYAAS